MAADYPSVPTDQLTAGPWELRQQSTDTVFEMPMATVTGHTVVYDDAELRAALTTAGAVDLLGSRASEESSRGLIAVEGTDDGEYWRFFFATTLSFSPPLAPGIGTASMQPTVVSEATRTFADDLDARGFVDVDRGRSQRVRTDSGDRARLRKFTATYPLDGDDTPAELHVEGWLAVWSVGGSFRIAGGLYPISGLDDLLAELPTADRPTTNPGTFRDDLLALIRGVE